MSRNVSTVMDRISGRGPRWPRTLIGLSLAIAFGSLVPAWAQTVVRQPYLQLETPTSMTIVWRTDTATNSRVRYGTVLGSLTLTATNASSVTNHIVTINGLSPATKYYYDAGSTTTVQAGGTSEHYFVTAPTSGSSAPFRAWIVGDSGTGGTDQAAVRDAMLTYTGANRPALMLHLGDIAYTSGSEQEFTDFHFGMYPDIFRHTVQWPTLGNHEGASTTSGQPGTSTGPYYDAFVLPTAGEAGGTASGTEAYYSFDYANVHFISLNAYQVSRSATGPMAIWLQNDLAATNAQWVVAFWHHPPYTHGTHNSDSETELREMRENLLPILEAGGVDLVLCGHSHDYERSYLIDGAYSTPTPNFATLEAQGHVLDDGDGKPTGSGAYQKGAGLNPHEGTVYVVAGHGGASTGGTLDHPVMYFSETTHGSCVLDVNGNSLTLTNVRKSGVVSDTFTIQKGPQAPKVQSTTPTKSAVLASLPTIRVTFSSNVTGVDAGDLTVNGSPATALSGAPGGSVYDFSGFAAPGNGHVGVVLAAGGIADAGNGSLLFAGNTWSYTIDTNPPRVFSETPGRGQAIGVLPSITVNFSKSVTGVVAGSLRVNGQPATTLSGISGSSGPYTFSGFPAPPTGQVAVTLLAGAIKDELLQPFAGDAWVYVLQPHLVINEYLTSNNSSAQDEFGEHDDYVEIYNPASVAVDMSGMHLTDTLDFPAQFQIPAGVVIPSHGHLIFWCDSQPGQGTFHTNFNLARAGESIGLFDTDENGFAAIDSTSWVNGTTDVPVGRFPDGAPGYVPMPATAGATNTIACTTGSQCAALANQCNTGVCTANRCVAQSANEGLSCDDGIACRAPDTCTAGICDGGPSTCTGGQSCNLVTGLCETPVADPLPIGVGVPWKYFKGTSAPPSDWNQIAFDDSGASWLTGNSGFGYGSDCVTDRGTLLSDMQNSYVSLYVRRLFRVDNPAAIQSLDALIDYDDAVVIYINGHEVGRNNVVGTPPSNTQLATADHECSTPVPAGTNNPPQDFSINLATAQLVTGNNVIAIQAHNLSLASSDLTLVPTLVATTSQGCAVNPECDDDNPCTDDACLGGVCQHANDNGNACSDGIACTNDACVNGACVTTSACTVGRTCNLGTGACEATPVTVTFQQGLGTPVYAGTVDTFVNNNAAQQSANNGAATPLVIDGDPDIEQALVRFDGIFGNGAGQIPLGATIQSATLTVNVTNPSVNGMGLHRMLQPWSAASNWTSLVGGITADGIEAVAATDIDTTYNNATVPILFNVSVTNSLAAWSAGATNLGWAFLPLGTDSIQFDSTDVATATLRPKLSVTYTFSPPCTVDADCTDNNACTGIETCVATVCQPGTALVCNDGNACTTDTCNPASGCVFSNNTNPCTDGNACTANDTCAGGACVPGAAANCSDANPCTDDSCNALTGCVHLNNTASCSDGNLCTTGDACAGGTCGGTAVSCPVGQTCNTGTGTCQGAPTTLTFQEGLSGYTGSVDTYIDAALGSQATVTPIVIDGSPVEHALLRFDGIFGAGANQIPAGATVSSATLTLWVGTNTSDESANPVNFHRLLHAWNATDLWAAYGVAPWNATGGIQNDDVDAASASTATVTMSTLGASAAINVTTSLQAWAAAPSSNFGWAILPTGTDGLRLESSESTTASNTHRPLLSVTFTGAAASCTTNADCSDNNLCNGIETCVANACLPGTALNCDDGNACTTDSCGATLGCQHANNTASCSDGNACTTNDACSGGVCVGGAAPNCDDANPCTNDSCNTSTGCVHAANTASCSDGNLCTTGDVCSGGTCGGTAVTCPVGQSCNPGTGACQSSTAPPLPIAVGATWKYFKGSAEPAPPPAPPAWAAIGFDDSLWLSGPSGFGYGPDGCMAQVATTLADMPSSPTPPGYFSIYTRKQFTIVNPATVTSLTATIDYDDSVVVYVNGTEVGRSASMGGTAGTPTAFNTPAPTGHECSVCDSPPCNPAQSFPINPSVLVAGTNVIAIHAHNQSLTSSDFILIPTLSATTAGCSTNADCSDNNVCNGVETCVATVCQPGTPLNCDDGNVCTTDTCSAALGCQHANNTAACNDGLACTAGDVCSGGICAGTPITCDDGIACTTDTCLEGSGCQHASNCPGGGSCSLQTGLCAAALMECSPPTIAAGSNSTADLTVTLRNLGGLAPVRGYQTQISIARTSGAGTVSVECPGGVAVNDLRPDYLFAGSPNDFPATNCALRRASSSLLSGGVTVPSTPAYLAGYTLTTSADATAGSTFSISLDQPVASSLVDASGQPLGFDRGPACILTIASCSTSADCNDGNPCTVDTCDLSLGCQHTPGNAGAVCRASAAACDQAETCTGTSAVCPSDQASPDGTVCNDGNACTQTDTCQAGACVGSNPVTCTASDQCHVAGICNTGTGACSNPAAPNGTACSDGSFCTTSDTCQAGACVGGAAPNCNDGNVCTTDGCNPASGCTHLNNTNPCDDGNACTTGDACSAGSCVGGVPPSCDDGNPCTADSCVSPSGCTHAAIAPCNFTAGDVVVYRVGSGTGSLVNTGNPVFLDEYTPLGLLVQSIPMPTSVALPNNAFFSSGTAGTEGMLSRSADKAYLVLTGYAATASGLAGTSGTTVPRVIGRVDVTKAIDTTTALTDFASGNNPRSATSDNGTRFWAAGGAGGVRYATLGASTSTDLTSTSPNGAYVNVRQMAVIGGQLYASSTSGTNTFKGVSAIGAGLPTTASQAVVRLNGLTDTTCQSSNTFFLADLTPAVPGFDTLYIADDTNSGAGGLQKFSLVGGVWVLNNAVEGPANSYRGLAGSVSGTTVTLYATRKGGGGATGGGELVSLVDASGYNANITATSILIATAANNTAFRGVAFAPEAVDRCAGVVCTALDSCHQAGVCDPQTGACSNPSSPNGSACNDGNACTQTDTCQLGVCTGSNPVTCTASDQCHVAGTCNTGTGACSNPAAPNGTVCSDGNACTLTDTCQAGTCVGAAPVTCNDGNPCTDDACNPLNGSCVFTANNANACTDGDVCTSDACSSGTCIHTPSGVCGVSGTVRYYRDDTANVGAGGEPSTKPVPNVGIDRTQDAIADATTDTSGAYTFGSLSGNVTLTTVAKFGSPRASDHNGAVTSFDASVVARAGASLITLSPNQRIAADVTGDGTVGAFDASFVARFAAGLINHFDVAVTTGSDWKFYRCDAYAFPGDPGCGSPSYVFTPISQALSGKDFYAVLYGDVTGNWQPAAPFASLTETVVPSIEEKEAMATDRPTIDTVRSPASPPAEVSIDGLVAPLALGQKRQLTVRLENADGILGLDLTLKYDATRLKIVGVQPVGIATGWGLAHSDQRGIHRITTYGVQPLVGSGPAVVVTVEGIAGAGPVMPVQIDGVANEGTIPLHATRKGAVPREESRD